MASRLIENFLWFAGRFGIEFDDIKDNFSVNRSIRFESPTHFAIIIGRDALFDSVTKGIKMQGRTILGVMPSYMFDKFEGKFGGNIMRLIPVEQIINCRFVFKDIEATIMTEEEKQLLTESMYVDDTNLPEIRFGDALSNLLMAKKGDWIKCKLDSLANPSQLSYYRVN